SRASTSPRSPLHALALPALNTIACARRVPRTRSRLSRTGAAGNLFWVNVAAATHGTSDTSTPRSGRPEALMPAVVPAARKPRAAVTEPSVSTVYGVVVSVMAASGPDPIRDVRGSRA